MQNDVFFEKQRIIIFQHFVIRHIRNLEKFIFHNNNFKHRTIRLFQKQQNIEYDHQSTTKT